MEEAKFIHNSESVLGKEAKKIEEKDKSMSELVGEMTHDIEHEFPGTEITFNTEGRSIPSLRFKFPPEFRNNSNVDSNIKEFLNKYNLELGNYVGGDSDGRGREFLVYKQKIEAKRIGAGGFFIPKPSR